MWSKAMRDQYGSILTYICSERLHWELKDGNVPFKNATPFADTSDYCIRFNDWPYGFAPGIRHLVVWLKTPFRADQEGHLTPESRAQIDAFVSATFGQRLAQEKSEHPPNDRVLWFKNWTALQSVAALEHFHVMVRGASDEVLKEWVGAENMEILA